MRQLNEFEREKNDIERLKTESKHEDRVEAREKINIEREKN